MPSYHRQQRDDRGVGRTLTYGLNIRANSCVRRPMTHRFNPTILREYDIRGIVGDTLTEADAYALGRTFASLASDEGARRIAVGRDGRTHSGMLEAALVRGLTEGGIDAVLTGMGPSPMLYFATHYMDVEGGI